MFSTPSLNIFATKSMTEHIFAMHVIVYNLYDKKIIINNTQCTICGKESAMLCLTFFLYVNCYILSSTVIIVIYRKAVPDMLRNCTGKNILLNRSESLTYLQQNKFNIKIRLTSSIINININAENMWVFLDTCT